MDGEAEVVRLHPERDIEDEDALVRRDAKLSSCFHRTARIDVPSRRAYCRQCDVELDAFGVLERIAGEIESYISQRKEFKRRIGEAQARLDETLRLERNARARLKKLDPKGKQPEIPWGETRP